MPALLSCSLHSATSRAECAALTQGQFAVQRKWRDAGSVGPMPVSMDTRVQEGSGNLDGLTWSEYRFSGDTQNLHTAQKQWTEQAQEWASFVKETHLPPAAAGPCRRPAGGESQARRPGQQGQPLSPGPPAEPNHRDLRGHVINPGWHLAGSGRTTPGAVLLGGVHRDRNAALQSSLTSQLQAGKVVPLLLTAQQLGARVWSPRAVQIPPPHSLAV